MRYIVAEGTDEQLRATSLNLADRLYVAGLIARSAWRRRWSADRIREYQSQLLAAQLRRAAREVPFYRRSIDSSTGGMPELRDFPVVRKSDVQADPAAFLSTTRDRGPLFESRTSGTTGQPTVTVFDRECWLQCRFALKARRLLDLGLGAGRRMLIVTEDSDRQTLEKSGLLRRRNAIFQVGFLPLAADISGNLQAFVEFRPAIVYSMPSYLDALIEHARAGGQSLPEVPTIFTSSEVLTPTLRQRFESALAGRVIDIYGSTEFKEIAVQCEAGGYHVNFESVLVESVPHEGSGIEKLLITSLTNRAMPLIRYDLGDIGTLEDGPCRCGRNGPRISAPLGRTANILRFSDGSVIAPYLLTTAMGKHPEVRRYQLVQRGAAALHVRVHCSPPLDPALEARLRATLAEIVPDSAGLTFESITAEQACGIGQAIEVSDEPQGTAT